MTRRDPYRLHRGARSAQRGLHARHLPRPRLFSRPRRSPARCRSAATRRRMRLRPLRRAALGSPFTAPRTTNERSWLYRIRPTVTHWGRSKGRHRAVAHRAAPQEARCRSRPCGGIRSPDPDEQVSFLEGSHHHHGRRRRHAGRHGGACLSHHPLDGGRVLLQCRRRDAVRAAAGRAAALDRVRHHRHRAGRDRRHPAG